MQRFINRLLRLQRAGPIINWNHRGPPPSRGRFCRPPFRPDAERDSLTRVASASAPRERGHRWQPETRSSRSFCRCSAGYSGLALALGPLTSSVALRGGPFWCHRRRRRYWGSGSLRVSESSSASVRLARSPGMAPGARPRQPCNDRLGKLLATDLKGDAVLSLQQLGVVDWQIHHI